MYELFAVTSTTVFGLYFPVEILAYLRLICIKGHVCSVHWKECLSSKATKLKVVNQSTFNHQCYVAEVMMPYFTTEHISSLLTKNPTKFPKQLLLSAIRILFEFSETTTPLKQAISARTRAHISLQQRPYWAPSRQGGNLISLRQGRVSAAPHMCTHVVYHGERASERWKSQLGTGSVV